MTSDGIEKDDKVSIVGSADAITEWSEDGQYLPLISQDNKSVHIMYFYGPMIFKICSLNIDNEIRYAKFSPSNKFLLIKTWKSIKENTKDNISL